jgi:hypothetical protein
MGSNSAQAPQALLWTMPSGNLTPPEAFSTPEVSTESANPFCSKAVTENNIALQAMSIDIFLLMTFPPFFEKVVNYSMPLRIRNLDSLYET